MSLLRLLRALHAETPLGRKQKVPPYFEHFSDLRCKLMVRHGPTESQRNATYLGGSETTLFY